ncbi:hypothetical protein BH10PSE2_BH10PSE2_23660 [soil metagenome]
MSPFADHIQKLSAKYRWLQIAMVAVGLLFMFHILTTPEPQLSLDVANGTYVSSGGATLILRDGKLSAGNGSIRYVIERDKQGAYIFPDGYLLAEEGGAVRVERNQDLMKSYLDKPERPLKISFWVWPNPLSKTPDLIVFDRQPETEPGVR